jgi:hypothetical protein
VQTSRRHLLLWIAAGLAVVLLSLLPSSALAHHVAGHGSSEGVRSINSLGSRGGSARSRVMLLDEFSHASRGIVPGQRNDLSLLGEYAPIPSFSFGAQLPFTIISEQPVDGPDRVQTGYGDTRAFLRVTPHADKLIHRTLTVAVWASFPTRTVRSLVDPGRLWSVTPSLIFTRTYERLYWQLLGVASTEWRPAGVALDISAGGQVGARILAGKIAVGGGALVDVRAINACRSVDGKLSYCAHSRAGERDRDVGTTRATALVNLAWNIDSRWSLTLGLQLPFTPRRDFDVGAALGVAAVF